MGASQSRRLVPDLTLIGFMLAGCVALAAMAGTQWLASQERRATTWAIEGQQVLEVIADARTALADIQNGNRGYTIEGTEESLAPYRQGRANIAATTARLRTMLKDTPEQQAHLADFERLLQARLDTAAQIVEARRTGGVEAVGRIIGSGAPAREMANLRSVLDAMSREQDAIFRERAHEQQATLSALATWVTGVTFLLLPGLGLLYAQTRRRYAAQQRVAQSEAELRSLNERLEGEVALRTRELRDANSELERAQLRLQKLSARIVEYQEQERRRLAYELHEEMAQSMSAIRIDLMRAQRGAVAGGPLDDALALLDALIAQTREMVGRLRPKMLDDLGLADALDSELAYVGKRNGWETRLRVEPDEFPPLPSAVATACFRVAQEALSNAARHAQAHRIDVGLRLQGPGLELTVQDDGVGFDPQQPHPDRPDAESFGLAFMRERARQIDGLLEIGPGNNARGVRVRLQVPLAAAAPADPDL
jgi:signal transduction histidine kinase